MHGTRTGRHGAGRSGPGNLHPRAGTETRPASRYLTIRHRRGLLSLHTTGLKSQPGPIAAPDVTGLPLMRRRHLVSAVAKLLSPAAEAFRRFMLMRGEARLSAMFRE